MELKRRTPSLYHVRPSSVRIKRIIPLAHVIIYRLRSHGYTEAPKWRHRGKHDGYNKSVAAVVVTAGTKVVVSGCMAAVKIPEEVGETEEGGGAEE